MFRMSPADGRGHAAGGTSHDSVLNWLLDTDPSIRWQVLRDLTDAPADKLAAERSRIANEGWGANLLAAQRPDGNWGDDVAVPLWWSNLYTLVYLADLGVDPANPAVQAAIDRVQKNVNWGPWHGNSPFFNGEVEPCINGRVIMLSAYFGIRADPLVQRLLAEQLPDGGWNCEAERGSRRSSFHTTICVLEGLIAYERGFGNSTNISAARNRAHEYLLDRRLLRRLSTGEVIDLNWTNFAYPPLWHYDVLRGLDYLRNASVPADPRLEEPIAAVQSRQQSDGRWLLDLHHKRTLYPEIAGQVGQPNRWITLRALRILKWYDNIISERNQSPKENSGGKPIR